MRRGEEFLCRDGNQLLVTKQDLNSIPYKDIIINRVLSKIEKENHYLVETDSLGIIFEKMIAEEERKDFGQFYTPQKIVNYILSNLLISKDTKLLDPTCGCGVFLVTAYNRFKKISKTPLNNIYGVDINESAAKITKANLWLRNLRNGNGFKTLEKNIRLGDSIVSNKDFKKEACDWNFYFGEVMSSGGFDLIIGNPPYVTLRKGIDYDSKELDYKNILNGNTNSASLILARSHSLLKEGGVVSFVLPKTILRTNSYSYLRKFILNNFKIREIFDLGSSFREVRGEQIILTLEKCSKKKNRLENKISIRVYSDISKDLESQKKSIIKQNLLSKYDSFLLFENKKMYSIINKLAKKGVPLGEFSEIFRGFSISPNSDKIHRKSGRKLVPIIKGNNISKFNFFESFFIDKKDIKDILRFNREKIILQNIFSSESGIIASLDKEGLFNFDTVTNIVLFRDQNKQEILLGLLNSKLINFYLIYALYGGAKLTMHTDGIYLGKLPINFGTSGQQKKILKLVEKLSISFDKKTLSKIDDIVYEIYGLSKSDISIINLGLEQIMSRKSIW